MQSGLCMSEPVVCAADHVHGCLFDITTGGISFESLCCNSAIAVCIADCKGLHCVPS